MGRAIETVSIEDVFPLEDEYGNSMARRDYTLKANKDYVKRLAESFNPETKQPDEPPVLVRDRGIYRIKAGNSRVEAMRLLKVKSFAAVVEDGDEKAVVEAAWRTDTKKTYEEAERADIFKALTLFGDDEYVSQVTGIEKKRVGRIRKGAERDGEAVEQMPLGWYEAMGEFEGDAEAQEMLLKAGARAWESVARSLRGKREAEERRAAIEAAVLLAGAEVAEAVPSGMKYVGRFSDPDKAAAAVGEGTVARFPDFYPGDVELYSPAPADPEADDRARRRDMVDPLWKETEGAREEWLAEHVLDGEEALAPIVALGDWQADSPYWAGVWHAMKHLRDDWPRDREWAVMAFNAHDRSILDWRGDIDAGSCRKFISLTDAMELCGYEPPEAEQRLYQMCVDAIGKEGKDE